MCPQGKRCKSLSSSAAVGAGVAVGEGTINETGGDFGNQSGDAGVLTGDGWVSYRLSADLVRTWNSVPPRKYRAYCCCAPFLMQAFSLFESVPSSFDSSLLVSVSAISLEVPRYLFYEERVGDDAGDDDDDEGVS
ncbi:hypothetical protein Tco_0695951 [Tanacetum coccineum]